jgi:DNA mismatch repair protein MutS2
MKSSERAAYTLEWKKFLELAQAEAKTERGKAMISSLEDSSRWAPDLNTSITLQHETQETIPLLDRDGLWGPLADLTDPADTIERLRRGSVLEISELVSLRKWLYAVDSWVQVPRDEIRGELFKKALSRLPDPHGPLQPLERILTPEGELSEKASPRLSSIYTEIRSLKREIGVVLDQLLKAYSQQGLLQESYTDVRDGRYVVPVKISSQNEVEGIIHEASASRQTVFIEPKEVASLNNRLRQRQNDLLQEIYTVLMEASKKLQPFADELDFCVEVLSHWDAVQARGRFGRNYSGKPIQVVEEREFFLRQTAHPLLWWAIPQDSIIRNEIEFSDPARTLLLTGPNTGGKTVLLKTLGLAALCARTGFPFPTTEQPKVPFFESVFADLGDPQSIEEHLSSFSGHVLRYKEILENVTDRSLVLVDELNSATDPEEGAALGRAFLETVMSRGAMIVTTTHDPHLKAMSISDSRILSASMQFDESSRTPTYRMVLGVPGRSRALETAERLGIPLEVILLAKQYLSKEHVELEGVLSKLESDSQEAARARKEAVALRDEAAKLKKEWTERTEASVDEMLNRTRQKLRRILEQAQDEVRSSVRKLDEVRNRHEIAQTRTQLNESLQAASELLEDALIEEAPEIAKALEKKKKEKQPEPSSEQPLQPGMTVRIPKWKNTGTVLDISGNKIKVAMGNLQLTLSPAEIQLIPGAAPKTQRAHVSSVSASEHVPSSLDLRGTRFEEAMSEAERYLDLAARSGSPMVTIIHGFGSGALREGVRKLLHQLPYVKEFRDGGQGQGGAGATIVEFEKD